MAEVQVPQHLLSKDYQRLQNIEKHVSRCVEIAAEVIDLLAQEGTGEADNVPDKARGLCAQFLENVKAAQDKVQEAVSETPTSRNFEQAAEVYEAVYRADSAEMKIKTIQKYLVRMQAALDAGVGDKAAVTSRPAAAENGQASGGNTPMDVSTERFGGGSGSEQQAATAEAGGGATEMDMT